MLAAQQLLGNTMPVTLSPELDEGKEWGWINFRQNSRHRVWCGWGGGGRDLLVEMRDRWSRLGRRGITIHQNLRCINHESLLNSKGVIIFWSVCSTFNNMVEVILDVWLLSMRSRAMGRWKGGIWQPLVKLNWTAWRFNNSIILSNIDTRQWNVPLAH